MPAPVASGWSESPGGACTHWKAPPCHGARGQRSFVSTDRSGRVAPIPDLPPSPQNGEVDGEPPFSRYETSGPPCNRFTFGRWRMDNFRVNSVQDLIVSGDQCPLLAALPRS